MNKIVNCSCTNINIKLSLTAISKSIYYSPQKLTEIRIICH